MKSVLVTGYFDRGNLGDEIFRDVWQYCFATLPGLRNMEVIFVTLDDVTVKQLESTAVIILAGGDILNEYFLVNLKETIDKSSFSGEVLAFSVGIPYMTVAVTSHLERFWMVSFRSKNDYNVFGEFLTPTRINYFADMSILLPRTVVEPVEFAGLQMYKKHQTRKNVGVFLARTIYTNDEDNRYSQIVQSIADALDEIVEQKWGLEEAELEIFLIPFNTFSANHREDDRQINRDVQLKTRNKHLIHNVTESFSSAEMYVLFKTDFHVAIAMRYHANMMSLITGVPFLPMYTTKKVFDLVTDVGVSELSYRLPRDGTDKPVEVDKDTLVTRFRNMYDNQAWLRVQYQRYVEGFKVDEYLNLVEETLEAALPSHVVEPQKKKELMCLYGSRSRSRNAVFTPGQIVKKMLEYVLQHYFADGESLDELTQMIVSKQLTFRKALIKLNVPRELFTSLADFLASLACYALTGVPYPAYHYGLSSKLLGETFDANAELTWLWEDFHSKRNNVNPGGTYRTTFLAERRQKLFNATYLGIEDFRGCHRSGWQFVLDHIIQFHSQESPLLFDNYVDRTFHWAHDLYSHLEIIPFQQPWCGFIHHTFDETFSPFNVLNLFRKKSFRDSLHHCVGLFTLSNDLAKKLVMLLRKRGYDNVPVKVFVHPTEGSRDLFSFERFCQNPDRMIVQIGGWMRDTYAIHRLHPTRATGNRTVLGKAALQGKNMENYFKPNDLKLLTSDGSVYDFCNPPNLGKQNKFVAGLLSALHSDWNSVRVLPTMNNQEYDQLLTNNVVFAKLVDASAVNTVIECIVRNTPILVNKHPAVEELLGIDYPFYYEDLTEAAMKCNDLDLLRASHEYLIQLDKNRFSIDHFLTEFYSWFQLHRPSLLHA